MPLFVTSSKNSLTSPYVRKDCRSHSTFAVYCCQIYEQLRQGGEGRQQQRDLPRRFGQTTFDTLTPSSVDLAYDLVDQDVLYRGDL